MILDKNSKAYKIQNSIEPRVSKIDSTQTNENNDIRLPKKVMDRINEYKNRNFRKKVLNIENTSRCTLLCIQCKRTTYLHLNKKPFPGKDLTPENFKKVVGYFDDITFGGQLSDPVFGVYFIELLKICKEYNKGPRVLTAATGKSESWYQQAFESNRQARWTFGIDGPPHLSHYYRVNQDGEFLFKMMCMAKKMGLEVYWQYIIFPYNESYVDECKSLAKSLQIPIEFIISERGKE